MSDYQKCYFNDILEVFRAVGPNFTNSANMGVFSHTRMCILYRNARARKTSKLIGYSEKKKEALGLLL